jgi:hypothetical protein
MRIVSKIRKKNHVDLTHQDRHRHRLRHLHLPFLRLRHHPVQHSSVDRWDLTIQSSEFVTHRVIFDELASNLYYRA